MSERPWTAEEAAQFLTKCPETIKRWARAGKLAGWKTLDGEWRFYPSDVRGSLRPGNKVAASKREACEDEVVVRARLDMAFARAQQRRTGS